MPTSTKRWLLTIGAGAYLVVSGPFTTIANAQEDDRRSGWGRGDDRYDRPRCDYLDGRDRVRCDRERARWERDRRGRGHHWERERERRKREEAKKKGVVAGVVGTAIVGGIIAAIASDGGKKKKKAREREEYCRDRYDNYDARTDSYQASDGRWYRCE
jgi:hypothetical protein